MSRCATFEPVTSNIVYVYIAPPATKVQMHPERTFTAEPGSSYLLGAEVFGSIDFANSIQWTSSNAVATFNIDKAISAVSNNNEPVTLNIAKNILKVTKVTITATAMDGSGKSAKIDLNLGKAVTKVTVNTPKDYKGYMNNSNTLQLSAVTDPVKPVTPGIEWQISKNAELGVTIDANGKLTAAKNVKNGKFTVTAIAKDGSGVTGEKELELRQLATGITIQKNGADVTKPIEIAKNITDAKVQLAANVIGPDGYDYSKVGVTWSISKNSKYATVDQNGLVALTAAGKIAKTGTIFTVTAITKDGSNKSASVDFTISEAN